MAAHQVDRARPAVAGVVAAGVALAVGELASGLSSRVSGPIVAVGDAIVRNAPGTTARSAVEKVGHADKTLLLTGIVVGWALVGLLVGRIAARHRGRAGAVFVAVASIAGLAAVREHGASPVLVLIATLVSIAAGLLALNVLLGAAAPPAESPARKSTAPVVDRRRFIGLAAATAGSAAVVGAIGKALAGRMNVVAARAAVRLPKALRPAPPVPAGSDLGVAGLAPIVTPNASFYRIDTALVVPNVDPDTWKLSFKGMVSHPYEITYAELLAMPMEEHVVTICCVSNEVGGNLIGNAKWLGVPLATLLDRAGVDPKATQVVGRSADGFTVGFPTKVGLDGRVAMLAAGMNGEPLPIKHGFPARLIVAGLYGYVSATKWITEIELTTLEAYDAYWIPRGWAKNGPIKTESRFDVIRRSSTSPSMVTLAGVAWAQTRGIDKVEVRVDQGSWQPATLATAINEDTWRQWHVDVKAAEGVHTFRVRATDGSGATQTANIAPPPPDGATGYHTVTLEV